MSGRTARPTIARGGMGLTMLEPRTAEAMVEQFRGEELLLRHEGEQDELLAKFFRRYARQVGKAWKRTALAMEDQLQPCQEPGALGPCAHPACLAVAVRNRSVETP